MNRDLVEQLEVLFARFQFDTLEVATVREECFRLVELGLENEHVI